MEWLNYHHLHYFWTVAREGSVTRASRQLHLAPSTVSAQLRSLEEALGEPLFNRVGRSLVLTDVGQTVFRYADEIFHLGRELVDTLRARPTGHPLRLSVGVVDAVAKLVTFRILQPALTDPEVQVLCREGKVEALLQDLSVHALDLVIADAPIGPSTRVRAFNHALGDSDVTVFGAPALAARCRPGFPDSLDGAPMLLPTDNTSLRRHFEQWLRTRQIRPRVVGEFEDSALMKVIGASGTALFPVPSVIGADVARQYGVEAVGRLDEVRESYVAISVERRIKHPAVTAIVDGAREGLFADRYPAVDLQTR